MKNKYILISLHSLLLFAILIIVSSFSETLIRIAGSVKEFRGFWTDVLFDRVNFFYSLIILFSLNNVFALNNLHLKTDFENSKDTGKLKFTLKNSCFWIECAIFSFCASVFTFFPPFTSLTYGFFSDLGAAEKYLLTLSIVIPVAFLIKLISYQSTLSFWSETSKKRKFKDTRNPTTVFILRLFFSSLIYIVGGFAVAIAFPMFSTAFSILGALKLSIIITVVLIVFAIIVISYLIRQYNAVRQKRAMLKKVKALGKAMGFSLETGAKPYSSSLPDNAYHFILRMKGRNIACRFVSSSKKSIPVYLHENGNAIYEDKKLLFRHLVTQKYAFDTDQNAEKIIIVCPCNGNIFIKNDREERLADVGDKCMEYKIYNSSGFLNAIERGYL